MIDANEVLKLLQAPSPQNLICRELEFRPQYLALFIAALSNTTDNYGYIVIGASRNIDNYCINGVSSQFKLEESIKRAIAILSQEPQIEFGAYSIEGKNVYVVKVNHIENDLFLSPLQKADSKVDSFVRDLLLACIKLQSRKLYSGVSEDERNDFIADLLETNGYQIKDQTRRGSSATGKLSGEVDIYVGNNGMPFTIIEALNLENLDVTYLDKHLDKIYAYDTIGNAFNICLAYAKVKDFSSFWVRYCEHVKKHKYPFELISSDINADKDYPFSDIRFMTTTHNRSGKQTRLYHICVKIQS